MNLEITSRFLRARPTRTISNVYVGDQRICYVLEDTVREIAGVPVEQWKIKGKTAIPSGRYEVTVWYSPTFKRNVLRLHDVPGYTDVLAHGGNTEEDTFGCQIPGFELTPTDTIRPGTTWPAVDKLVSLVELAAAAGDKTYWTIDRNADSQAGNA